VENVAEVSTALQPTNIPAVKKRGAKTVLAQDSPELLQFIQQVRQADDEGVDVSNILHALNLKTLANICRHLKCKQGGKKCEYISNITERLMVGGDDDSAASGRNYSSKAELEFMVRIRCEHDLNFSGKNSLDTSEKIWELITTLCESERQRSGTGNAPRSKAQIMARWTAGMSCPIPLVSQTRICPSDA
jgi:hypothetical protein